MTSTNNNLYNLFYCGDRKIDNTLLYVVHSRSQQHANYAGSTPLFDDTSTAQQESMGGPQGMPQQFAGMDFMQAPMTNMAFQYGSNVASHGKEYVEKNVSTTCCDI